MANVADIADMVPFVSKVMGQCYGPPGVAYRANLEGSLWRWINSLQENSLSVDSGRDATPLWAAS